MEPLPTYQEILSELFKTTKQNKDLKQQMEQLKYELYKIKSAYAVVKKNELLLVSVLQQSKL
jgi:hypothetical protein